MMIHTYSSIKINNNHHAIPNIYKYYSFDTLELREIPGPHHIPHHPQLPLHHVILAFVRFVLEFHQTLDPFAVLVAVQLRLLELDVVD